MAEGRGKRSAEVGRRGEAAEIADFGDAQARVGEKPLGLAHLDGRDVGLDRHAELGLEYGFDKRARTLGQGEDVCGGNRAIHVLLNVKERVAEPRRVDWHELGRRAFGEVAGLDGVNLVTLRRRPFGEHGVEEPGGGFTDFK